MRNLRKVFAMVLAVAMVFSVISVGVFADDDAYSITVKYRTSTTDSATVTSVKPGKTIYADVYVPAGQYDALAVAYGKAIGDLTEDDITVGVAGSAVGKLNTRDKKAQAKWTSPVTVPENTPVLTIKVEIPDSQSVADDTIVLNNGSFMYSAGTKIGVEVEDLTAKINVVEGFIGEEATDIVAEYSIGTDVVAELAKKTATVTKGTDESADGYATTGWTAPENFDKTVPGSYTFTGKVVADATKAAEWTGDMAVTANVTLKALTDATVTASATELAPMVKDGGYDEAALKALVVSGSDKIAAVTVSAANSDNTITDTYDITAENVTIEFVPATPDSNEPATVDENADNTPVASKLTAVGDQAKATISISGESKNKKFNLAEAKTIVVTITLAPAEITNKDEVEIKIDNSITNTTTSLTLTVTDNTVEGEEGTEVEKEVAVTLTSGSKKLTLKKTIKVTNGTATSFELTGNGTDEGGNEVSLESWTESLEVGTKVDLTVEYAGQEVKGDAIGGVSDMEVVNSSSSVRPGGVPSGGSGTASKTQYSITVAETENGTASVAAKAAKGDSVTVTTTADAGYKFASMTVTAANGTNVPVDGKTFTMPASNVTVKVTFEEGEEVVEPTEPSEPVADGEFADLTSAHWAYEAVTALKELGIINGVSADSFAPDNKVTRAEFTKMVAVLFGLEASSTESKFVDCGADDWFTPYVLAAAEAGYVNGVDDTHFAPDAQITRQDICTILGRVLSVNNAAAADFTDAADIASYAVDYVNAFVELGVLNGYDDGTFLPNADASRAEAAKILFGITKLDNEQVISALAALKGEAVDTDAEAVVDTDADAEVDADAEAEVDADAEAEVDTDVDVDVEENIEDIEG